MAASQELKDRMMYENRGHCLLEACRQADLSKVKKFLSSSSNTSAYVAELLAFKHPYSGDNAVHCTVVSPFPKRKAIGTYYLIGVCRPTENGVSKSEKWFCLKFENFTIFSSQVA